MKSASQTRPAVFFIHLRSYSRSTMKTKNDFCFALFLLIRTFVPKQKLYNYEEKQCISDAAAGCYVCSMFTK